MRNVFLQIAELLDDKEEFIVKSINKRSRTISVMVARYEHNHVFNIGRTIPVEHFHNDEVANIHVFHKVKSLCRKVRKQANNYDTHGGE